MRFRITNWDSDSPDAWASVLGMFVTPLLNPAQDQSQSIRHAALLDGYRGSFNLSVPPADADGPIPEDLASWIWSARLRHSISVDRRRNRVTIIRWDNPSMQVQSPLPQTGDDVLKLQTRLDLSSHPTQSDVISFVMRLFRAIRDIARHHPPAASIRALNTLLLAADSVREGSISEQALVECRTLRQAPAPVRRRNR